MSDVRILVTGGAGFIGSHIVERLDAEGIKVAVLDNFSTGKRENLPGVELYEVDLRDQEGVLWALRDFQPTHISHQAAQASVAVSVAKARFDAEVNLLGGINLLEAARAVGTRRLVFASTGGAIYGEVPENKPADEDWPAKPESPYAASKAGFELYLQVYGKAFGLSSAVLRYSNVYGPRQDPHGEAGVIAIFTKRLLAGEEATVFAKQEIADEGCIRDYIYVADVVSANLLALSSDLEGTFNVSTGKGLNTMTVLHTLAQVVGCTPQVNFAPPRPGDLQISVLDSARLRKLGWQAEVDFSEGIRRTVAWFEEQDARVKAKR